jgi:membrane protein
MATRKNPEKHPLLIKLNAVSLAFTVGGVIGILLAIGLVVVTPVVLSMVGLGSAVDALIRFGRWPVLGVILLLALAGLVSPLLPRDAKRRE